MATVNKREWTNKDGSTSTAWRVQYKDSSGKRRSKDFALKRDADTFAGTIGGEIVAGRHVHDRNSVTIAEAVEAWLTACEQTGVGGGDPVEPHTIRQYRQMAEDHIVEILGGMKISKLTAQRVTEFRDVDCLAGGKSRNTTKVALGYLAATCKFARSKGWLAIDPCEGIKIANAKRHKKQIMPPSHADIDLLLSTAKSWIENPPKVDERKRDPIRPYEDQPGRWRVRYTQSKGARVAKTFRNLADAQKFAETIASQQNRKRDLVTRRAALLGYGVVKFLVETGARLSEARGAPKRDFDADEKTYKISQRADENGNLGVPKSLTSRRTIELGDDLVEILKELSEINSDCSLLFPSADGTPFAASNFYKRYWIPLLLACDLAEAFSGEETGDDGIVTKFGIHYLRHYHASRCLENGMDMKELSAHMGHSGIAITMDIYSHIFEDVQAKRRRRAKVTGEAIASE